MRQAGNRMGKMMVAGAVSAVPIALSQTPFEAKPSAMVNKRPFVSTPKCLVTPVIQARSRLADR